jgi:hypothetical protein
MNIRMQALALLSLVAFTSVAYGDVCSMIRVQCEDDPTAMSCLSSKVGAVAGGMAAADAEACARGSRPSSSDEAEEDEGNSPNSPEQQCNTTARVCANGGSGCSAFKSQLRKQNINCPALGISGSRGRGYRGDEWQQRNYGNESSNSPSRGSGNYGYGQCMAGAAKLPPGTRKLAEDDCHCKYVATYPCGIH